MNSEASENSQKALTADELKAMRDMHTEDDYCGDKRVVRLLDAYAALEDRLLDAEQAMTEALAGHSPGLIRSMAPHGDRIVMQASALLPLVEWIAAYGVSADTDEDEGDSE